ALRHVRPPPGGGLRHLLQRGVARPVPRGAPRARPRAGRPPGGGRLGRAVRDHPGPQRAHRRRRPGRGVPPRTPPRRPRPPTGAPSLGRTPPADIDPLTAARFTSGAQPRPEAAIV